MFPIIPWILKLEQARQGTPANHLVFLNSSKPRLQSAISVHIAQACRSLPSSLARINWHARSVYVSNHALIMERNHPHKKISIESTKH
jgi:hypothetical protein